jgi:copper transport protein
VRRRYRIARFAAAVALTAGLVALGAAPAYAHATLTGTEPTQSQQFPSGKPPAVITIRFDEGVVVAPTSVQVYDAHAKAVKLTSVGTVAEGRVVQTRLPRLGDGTYVVTWRVTSADAHPVQGAFTFGVGKAAGSSANVGALLSARAGERTVGTVFGIDRALAFAAVLVLLGALAFMRWIWPDPPERSDVTVLLVVALAVAVVSSLAAIALQSAYVNGRNLDGLFDTTQVRAIAGTRFGHAALVRAGLVIVVALVAWPRRHRSRQWAVVGDVAFVVLALLTCATFSYAGHGNTGRLIALGFGTDLTHVAAASLWLGGVAVLAVALRDPDAPRGAARAAARFSKVALVAIGVIAVSGVVQAWRQIETGDALWHTAYSRMLFAKLLIVLALVVVASATRDVVRTRVVPHLRAAWGPGAARREADPDDVRQLRDAVWIEVVLAVVVLVITAGLVNAQPAREAAATTPRTYEATLRTSGVSFDVAIQPVLTGDDTIVVVPRKPNGKSTKVLKLDATLALPGRVAPIPITFAVLARNRYVGTVQVPLAGTWRLHVRALRSDIDEDVADASVRFG